VAMAPKKAPEPPPPEPEPVVEEEEEEPPRPPTPPTPLPPILTRLGWTKERMEPSQNRFYWHAGRQQAQPGPPYYEILGLDPEQYARYSKSEIKKAWFDLKQAVYGDEYAPLTAHDEDKAQDWAVIMEAWHVLVNDPAKRAVYEQDNLSRSGKQLKHGMLANYRVQEAERARREREAEEAARAYAEAAAAAPKLDGVWRFEGPGDGKGTEKDFGVLTHIDGAASGTGVGEMKDAKGAKIGDYAFTQTDPPFHQAIVGTVKGGSKQNYTGVVEGRIEDGRLFLQCTAEDKKATVTTGWFVREEGVQAEVGL